MKEQGYCYLCKNRCPLDNPKCGNAVSALRKDNDQETDFCRMCPKKCHVSKLECSLGRTIREIKNRDR